MNVALLVSINNYPGNPLRGCLNDQENIRKHLVEDYDFSPMHIKCLRDQQATKDAILGNLQQMIEQMQEGDHGVFHFSGHGSQLPDSGPDQDEPDQLDEVLCCSGMDFADPSTYITDDEIRRVLSLLGPKSTLDCIFDSCHSGTGTRAGDGIPRCIPFPLPLAKSWHPRALLKDLDQPGVALFSGCRDTQTSADAYIGNQYQGAFTWALTMAMSGLDLGMLSHGNSRGSIIKKVGILLDKYGYDQEPQLETSDELRQREIFT